MLEYINKILSKYSCKIITTGSLGPVEPIKLKNININQNLTVAELELNLKNIFQCNIKVVGCIHKSVPKYQKLKDLIIYQENIYNPADLDKKLKTLIEISQNSLNYNEDWIIRSLNNIYVKIKTQKEKNEIRIFFKYLEFSNQKLYIKIKNYLMEKFPDIDWF